jgi:hypothetical protein
MHEKDIIDLELVNDIKSKSKCTQYKEQYSKEFRIKIFVLRNHDLTYRGIMEYCITKYGFSPSLCSPKKLITYGEKYFSRKETNKDNDNIAKDKSIGIKEKPLKQKDAFNLQKIKARISELYYKDRRGETTTIEHDEFIQSLALLLKYHIEHGD